MLEYEMQETFTDEQYVLWREAHRGMGVIDRSLDKIRAMGTRELLVVLHRARSMGGWYSPEDVHARWGFSVKDLKAELAKRPHVPGRAEAKELRRKRALGHAR